MKFWLAAVLCMGLGVQFETHAKIVGLFDIDGTIFNDRGPTAAWVTPWLLKRVEQLETPLQQRPDAPITVTLHQASHIAYYNSRYGTQHPLDAPVRVSLQMPDQLAVSYDDFLNLQPHLSRGEALFGGLNPVLLKADPLFPERERLIIPGYYRIFDGTFKYYRESTGLKPKNYFRLDWIQARDREAALGAGYSWKGPAWSLFQAFMANPETVLSAQRLTSRGHKLKDYYSLDDELVRQGEIKNARSSDGRRPMVYSLNQPDSRIYGRSLAEKKANVVHQFVQALYHSGGSKHKISVAGRMVSGHTLIIAEDEPSYVEAIAEVLMRLSGSYFADRVELVLFNTGSEDELKKARYPYRFTRFEAGREVRPASQEEIDRWHDPAFLLQAQNGNCEKLLGVEPNPEK